MDVKPCAFHYSKCIHSYTRGVWMDVKGTFVVRLRYPAYAYGRGVPSTTLYHAHVGAHVVQ